MAISNPALPHIYALLSLVEMDRQGVSVIEFRKNAVSGAGEFLKDEGITYLILTDDHGNRGITCLYCGRTSWSDGDVQHKYCAYCKRFHGEPS